MLGPLDALPVTPRRIAIAGRAGAQELASRLARILELPVVSAAAAGSATDGRWITDLPGAREHTVAASADTLVWLDLRAWARGAREALAERIERVAAEHPHLQVMRLRSKHEVEQFVFGIGTHRGE
jgi:hypothetical protein